MKFNTKTIHAGQAPEETSGAVMPPIFQTSTYAQKAPNDHQGYDYARVGNPTRTALEKMIAGLENADEAICFSSGVAAIDAIIRTLKPGDHVIASNDLYGGTYRLFTKMFEPIGISFTFVDMTKNSEVEEAISDNTKLIWIETPTNPLLRIADINTLSNLGRDHGILTAVDNTFATPYLQQPLELGADIVMHSATKYLGGHSDVVMGSLVVNDDTIADRLYFIQKACGAIPGPMDCFLVSRGIKTLHLRMQRHCENGRAIAEYLKTHKKVENVYWPGFKNHPSHLIAKNQMKDFGGMVSFTTKGNSLEQAMKFLEQLKVFTLAESLGGVESLAGHPASMTHGSIPKEKREKTGVVDSLIRLSVGVEDIEDLIEDLRQAFV